MKFFENRYNNFIFDKWLFFTDNFKKLDRIVIVCNFDDYNTLFELSKYFYILTNKKINGFQYLNIDNYEIVNYDSNLYLLYNSKIRILK